MSCPLGEVVLSQHQQAFLAENAEDVTRVARRVLSTLASAGGVVSCDNNAQPKSTDKADVMERLYAASISRERSAFSAALEAARQSTGDTDDLAFEFIPSIARRLGAAWVQDAISFSDVTIGCTRLQSALHGLPDRMRASPRRSVRRDCLVLVPKGAQHTLGALVLVKQLRHAGQSVVTELEAQEAGLRRLADQHRFDLVLISASCCECPTALRAMVEKCRGHWPASKIVIGGSICETGADVVRFIGADQVTSDWQEALEICN